MNNEARYFDALKEIARYQSVEQLHKKAEREWGVSGVEALAMAYDNIIETARWAIKGKRRPKEKQ